MITRLLNWQVVSDANWQRVCQALCTITACLVLAAGAISLVKFDLSLPQFVLGLGVLFSVALQLVILCELLALKRKAA